MKKEQYTENLKIRVTKQQKEYIEQTAKANNQSTSNLLRNIIFHNESSSEYAIQIHNNLIKNEIWNHITYLPMPNKYIKLILKELITIE